MRTLLTVLTLALLATPARADIIQPSDGHVLIPWDQAPQFTDRRVVVYGRIVVAKDTRQRAYLNFHQDFRNHFTLVIDASDYAAFGGSPEKMFGGKNVVAYGFIQGESARPEMNIRSADHIAIAPDDDAALASFARTRHPGAHEPSKWGKPALRTAGQIRIGTYNLLNLFDEADDPYRADEVMRPKPRDEMTRVAERIRRLDADVLALQEIENRPYLERFLETFLPDMGYAHIVLVEANNHRGIDCALVSRVPVGPVTSYQHVPFKGPDGHTYRFQRDLLRVQVLPPGAAPLDVFVVHLKSKYGGAEASEPVRQAEAAEVRRVVDDLLAHDPAARFVICGDYNDTFDSASLALIRGSGATELKCPGTALPDTARITYNREPYLSMIDFILCSPAVLARYVDGSYEILPGSVESSGSDHNPSAAAFKL